MNPNDLAALKAAFNGVGQTFRRVSGYTESVARLESGFDGIDPKDLMHAAAAHAMAAAALAGFIRQLLEREGGATPDTSVSTGPDRESEEQR
jgi:hypothetical protein